MKEKHKNLIAGIIVALILCTTFFITNNKTLALPSLTKTFPMTQEKIVTKIIDGDTIILDGGETIRFMGIDTDEKSHKCYAEAKNQLEKLLLGKKIVIEPHAKDTYGRTLAYIFSDGININTKMVKDGLAVSRMGEEKMPYDLEIKKAENEAKTKKTGCKWDDNIIPNVCEAINYFGMEKTLQGKVVDVYTSKSGTVFINFEEKYPSSCFTSVIFKKNAQNMKDIINQLNDKNIYVSGMVQEYRGKPEIIINNKKQISFL